MNRWLRGLVPLAVVVLASSACTKGGDGNGGTDDPISGKTVSVIGTWGGDEQAAFLKMVAPWEQKTGAKVKYTGTRDINAVLTAGVACGVRLGGDGLGRGPGAAYGRTGYVHQVVPGQGEVERPGHQEGRPDVRRRGGRQVVRRRRDGGGHELRQRR